MVEPVSVAVRPLTPAANHCGPLALCLSAGFSVVREDDDGNVFVRKALVPTERIE